MFFRCKLIDLVDIQCLQRTHPDMNCGALERTAVNMLRRVSANTISSHYAQFDGQEKVRAYSPIE